MVFTYLDEHAAELFRAELMFALFVIAVGCGIALQGAANSGELEAALFGEDKVSPSGSLLPRMGKLPLNAIDLTYGAYYQTRSQLPG